MESVNVFPSVGIGKKRVLRAQQKEDYRMRVRERVPTSSSAKPRPIRWKTIVDGALARAGLLRRVADDAFRWRLPATIPR